LPYVGPRFADVMPMPYVLQKANSGTVRYAFVLLPQGGRYRQSFWP
jgi:hypothetical protein